MRITSLHAASLALILVSAVAAARPAPPDVALSVNPMVLEFTAGYGQEEHATVLLANPSATAETIAVRPFDWRVTRDGTFAIEPPGTERSRSLTRLLSIHPGSVILNPNETRAVEISVRLPDRGAGVDPVAWGGLLLQATPSGSTPYVTPGATVVVYNSARQFQPRLQLARLAVRRSSNSAGMLATIRNTGATYVRPLLHLTLTSAKGVARSIDIPFNAILPGDERIVRTDLGKLPGGKYLAQLTVSYGGDRVIEGQTHVDVP